MSAPMTPERLAEILARAEAATPGPWEECPEWDPNFYAFRGGSYLRGVGTLNFGDGDDAEADLAFTLNARMDVPNLVAEVQRLQVRVATLEMAIGTARAMHRKHVDSEHCQYDGMEWPCPNVLVLDGTATGLAAGVDAMGPLSVPTGDTHPAPCWVPESPDCTCPVTVTNLAATVQALGALPMPTVGDLAEQRHLVDPLDHVLEHLADDRPTVTLPAQRDQRGQA